MKFLQGFLLTCLPVVGFAQCTTFEVETGAYKLPVIQAEFMGQKRSFVFDLGMARGLTLAKELFQKVEPEKARFKHSSSDLTGIDQLNESVIADTLVINHHTFHQVDCAEYKPWGLWLGSDAPKEVSENTIGRGLFTGDGYLYYSRSHNQVKWCEEGLIMQERPFLWQPLVVDEEGIHLTLWADDQPLDFVLDSGASVSIIKPNQNHPKKPCPKSNAHECSDFKNLKVNDKSLPMEFYRVELSEAFEADGLLGNDFFERYDIVIDQHQRRLGVRESL